MKIELLTHVSFEGPGLIESWADAHQHSLRPVGLYRGEALMPLSEIDLLIIMGGPMSVTQEARYPWLRTEKAHLREALDAGVPALGVCLGAQLLAEALGATVTRNPEREIGWFPVDRAVSGDPATLHDAFPSRLDVFHWHGETFSLPDGARHLARSPACENQAFVFNERVVALQFHLEMMPSHIQKIIDNGVEDLENPGPWVQDAHAMMQTPFPPPNRDTLFRILDHLAGQAKGKR